MRRNGHAVLICALCVLCGAVVARASVVDYLGKPITSVRLGLADGLGASRPLGRVEQLSLAVGDPLRERGYRHPEVTPRVEVDPRSERAALRFNVTPGSRTPFGTIPIVGPPMMPQEDFL